MGVGEVRERNHLEERRFKKTRGAFSPVYANVGLGVDNVEN